MTDVVIDVRVIPRAKHTQTDGKRDGTILIRLAAPPVDGAANEALIAFLASTIGVPRRNIRVISGERGRRKRVAIAGATLETVTARLGV